MEEPGGKRGGSEGDIRSLFYWSKVALYALVASAVLWVALGAWRIWEGLTWIDRAKLIGTTQSYSDITTGVVLLVVAVATGLLARLVYLDIYQVFRERRFQVPREKLLVYGILGLPFGFVIAGSLLLIINIKLSHPDFLPSHAEAYPEAMPGFVQVPRAMLTAEAPAEGYDAGVIPIDAPTELAPLGFDDVPVSDEEAQPAPEFFGEDQVEGPVPAPVPQVLTGPVPGPPPAPAPTPAPAMAEAYVEEIPEEEIPEVMAEIAPGEPVPADYVEVEAIVEEVPADAVVEAVVEDVPEGDEGDFEVMEAPTGEEPEGPRTIEEAHEDLLGKLLGK